MRTATAPSVADILDWQNTSIRTGEYEYIGKVWAIVLEDAAGGPSIQDAGVRNRLGKRIEFYGDGPHSGLPLAQTLDKSTLLMLSPILKPDGSVGLPDIPDPTWVPRIPTSDEVTGVVAYVPDRPRMIRQSLSERSRGLLRGTDFLICGPVAQLLVRPEAFPGQGWILPCGVDPATGLQMDLLIHQHTGRAHFYGGRYTITRIG